MGKKRKLRYLQPSVMWRETVRTRKQLRKEERSPIIDRGREATKLTQDRLRVQARSMPGPNNTAQ